MNNNKYRLYKAACGVFRVKRAYIKMAGGVNVGGAGKGGGVGSTTKAVSGFVDDVRGMLPGQKAKQVHSYGPNKDKRILTTPYAGGGTEQLSSGNFGKTKAPSMSRAQSGGTAGQSAEHWDDVEKQLLSDGGGANKAPEVWTPYTAPDLNAPKPIRHWNNISGGIDSELDLVEHWDDVLKGLETEVGALPKSVLEAEVLPGYGQRIYNSVHRPASFIWNGVKKNPARAGLTGATALGLAAESQDRGLSALMRQLPSYEFKSQNLPYDPSKDRQTPVYDRPTAWKRKYTGKPTDADRVVPAVINGKLVDVYVLGGQPFIELPDGQLAPYTMPED